MKVFHEKTGLFFKDAVHGFEASHDRILIERAPEAELLLTDYYNEVESLLGEGQPLRGDPYAQRITEHAVRLASLFVGFGERSSVTPEDIQPAIQLSKHYLSIWHGLRCRAKTDVRHSNAVDLLRRMVQRYPDRSLIDVRAMCQAFGFRRDYVDPLLDELENLGAIEVRAVTNRRTRKTIMVDCLDLVAPPPTTSTFQQNPGDAHAN